MKFNGNIYQKENSYGYEHVIGWPILEISFSQQKHAFPNVGNKARVEDTNNLPFTKYFKHCSIKA